MSDENTDQNTGTAPQEGGQPSGDQENSGQSGEQSN
jgi:hypothetical protein